MATELAKAATRAPRFIGGSEADRQAVIAVHYEYLAANDVYDCDRLRAVWSEDTECEFFNTDGHAIRGIDEWCRVWDYNRPRMQMLGPSDPGDITVVIRGDMGVVYADNVVRYRVWKGPQEHDVMGNRLRFTHVCTREPSGRWKVIHVHFSAMVDKARRV